jgi:hypothetical protein
MISMSSIHHTHDDTNKVNIKLITRRAILLKSSAKIERISVLQTSLQESIIVLYFADKTM